MRFLVLFLYISFLSLSAKNFEKELSLRIIDKSPNGFQFLVSSKPNASNIDYLYNTLKITDVIILDGSGSDIEYLYLRQYPNLHILYNEPQNYLEPLAGKFLSWIDQTIGRVKKDNLKLLVRDSDGYELVGRIMAYYQMRYLNFTPEQAYKESIEKYLPFGSSLTHTNIFPQIIALNDYINGERCSQESIYCVK